MLILVCGYVGLGECFCGSGCAFLCSVVSGSVRHGEWICAREDESIKGSKAIKASEKIKKLRCILATLQKQHRIRRAVDKANHTRR